MLESKNFTFYYSCHPEKHIFETGFLVDGRIKHLILDFKPICMHICKLPLKGQFRNYSFVFTPLWRIKIKRKRIFMMN
jgi:hypothetical protein